jgi:hypothetical protein
MRVPGFPPARRSAPTLRTQSGLQPLERRRALAKATQLSVDSLVFRD